MKHAILDLLRRDGAIRCLRPLRRGATILVLHRFADPDAGNPGHPLADLRANLAFLRRHRFHLLGLRDLMSMLERGVEPRPGTVVVTVDDGYADFVRVGAPVFAEFDCPVTVFVTTGFVDGSVWLWWDQLEFVFRQSARRQMALTFNGRSFQASWTTPGEAELEAARLAELLERIDDDSRRRTLAEVGRLLEVEVPDAAPPRYTAMTWDDVRRCERAGVTFGPHSVTHPILAQLPDAAARSEITGSWARLQSESASPLPVFCYPNGRSFTHGPRELQLVRSAGLQAAVTTAEGHVSAAQFRATPEARLTLPRYDYYDDLPHFAQIVSGVQRIKSAVQTMSFSRRQSA